MKKLIVLLACFVVLGCQSFPGTRDVNKPVSVPCLLEVPVPPNYAFESQPTAVSDDQAAHQVRVLWLDREAAINYAARWELAAAGCLVIPQ